MQVQLSRAQSLNPRQAQLIAHVELNSLAERMDIEGVLQQWVASAPEPDARADYREAAEQIRRCWQDPTQTELDLSGNFYLRDLPPLPPHIKDLNLRGVHHLESLPDLSGCKNLEKLNLFSCENLRDIPDLRALSNLRMLNTAHCESLVHPPMVAGLSKLESLYMSRCRALRTPPDLSGCSNLKTLNMSRCIQIALPPNVSNLRMLEDLGLDGCRGLVAPPDVRHCEQLVSLTMDGCSNLSSPPVLGAHPQLVNLSMVDVPLRRLPENIQDLPADCRVFINGTQLPPENVADFREMMDAPGYAGVRIDFDLSTWPNREIPSPEKSICEWREEGGHSETPSDPKFAWLKSRAYDEKINVSKWLRRLRESSEYMNHVTRPDFIKRVNAVLDEISQPNNTDLRTYVVISSVRAVTSCGDRVALALADIEKETHNCKAASEVALGKYDDSPASLVALGVGMYRLTQLERLAKDRIQALSDRGIRPDEVEVHLGYLHKFGGQFNLPVQAKSMRYEQLSMIGPAEISQGEARLRNLERTDVDEGAIAFLSAWRPLNLLMQRQSNGPAMQQEIAARIEARKAELQEQVINAPDEATGKKLMDEFSNLSKTVGEQVAGARIASWLAQAREQDKI